MWSRHKRSEKASVSLAALMKCMSLPKSISKYWRRWLLLLRNKFNREVKDMYTENYKTWMKEMEEDTHKWRDTVFMDWKTQRSNDDNSPQIDLTCLVELISRNVL